MSLKCRRLQTLAPPGFVRCSSQIWHSALKRGVVVAPLFLSPYPQNPKQHKIKKQLKRLLNVFNSLVCSFKNDLALLYIEPISFVKSFTRDFNVLFSFSNSL